MPILRSEQRALEEFRERLSSSYLVKDMKVFGSKARGADVAISIHVTPKIFFPEGQPRRSAFFVRP